MIVAIFSDVHANLLALEAFLTAVGDVAERYLCLGDIVNYGPWNDECLERVHGLPGVEIVQGNHDRMFLDESLVDLEAPLVQEFYRASRQSFTRTDLVAKLPERTTLGSFTCVHTIGNERVCAESNIEVDRDYAIGHSHWQFAIERNGFRIVNPGSVGQNRDQIDRVDFALYDSLTTKVVFQRIPYDFEGFLAELRKRRWPISCIEYYERKLRQAGDRRDIS